MKIITLIKNKFMNKFKNNFYFRMVILYSTIGIAAILIFMSIFIKYQNESLKKQKMQDYTNSVKQFQIFSDQYVLDKVYSIVTNDIFQVNTYGVSIIEDSWAYRYNPTDFTNALNIKRSLNNLQSNIDYIESITIYNREYDTYISSQNGVYYNVTDQIDEYSSLVNYELLNSITSRESNQFWVSPSENRSFYKNKSIVSFVQLTPIFMPVDQCDIIISINLDMNKIFKEFFSKTNIEKDNFKIIDNENNLLFDIDTNRLLYSSDKAEILDKVKTTSSGYERIKKDGKWQDTIWLTSAVSSWKYIYTTRDGDLMESIFSSLGYILIWGFIIALIVLGAVQFIGKWLYKPLNHLVKTSSKRLTEVVPEGDIKTINEAFFSINNKLNQLEDIVEKNDVLILNNIIRELISSKISTLFDLNDRLRIINKKFINSSFCILLIKIDPTIYEDLTYEERELVHITVNEIIGSYYNGTQNNKFKMANIFDYDGYFTCIINLNEDQYELEVSNARKVLKILNNQFTSIFNIALTKPFDNLENFYNHHQDAMDYFKYRFIYGNGNVFTEDSIKEYEQNSADLSKDALQNFEVYLKTQKLDLIKENIMFLFNQIGVNGYSYLYMYNLSIQLIGLIANECMAQNISNPELSQQKLLESYSKIRDLDECMSWFYDVIDKFGESIHVRNTNIDGTVIADIMDYIKGNVDYQLSLNSVADHFNLSTGHLSRLFKEKVGTNFSEFVSTIKFEKAAEMLVQDTKLRVADIAEQLGYSNVTYFTKLFKERHGMTPIQYRKLNK